MPERKAYHPLHFKLMSFMTAASTGSFLREVENSEQYSYDLSDYQQATLFFDSLLSSGDSNQPVFLFEQIKQHIHTQFCEVLSLIVEHPQDESQAFIRDIVTTTIFQAVVRISSKMKTHPSSMGTVTGGFGSGISSLLMSTLYEKLYGPTHFSSLGASADLARIEFEHFASFLELVGFVTEEMSTELLSSTMLLLKPGCDGNGYNQDILDSCEYSLDEYTGCPALKPVPPEFRTDLPDSPKKSGISQLQMYLMKVVDNLLKWMKEKGGSEYFEGKLFDHDLEILNGTSKHLPLHPETGQKPSSLID